MPKKKIVELVGLAIGALLLITAIVLLSVDRTPEYTSNNIVNEAIEKCKQNCDFGLEIKKIEVIAPIIADVPGNNKKQYLKAMQNGVAHFAGTKKPGEGGNIFIFGHSSYYSWDKGNFKNIFRDLEDLVVGDEITVWYQDKKFTYRVFKIKVVSPSDGSSLLPTDKEQLTLMTCVPVGTAAKRLIISAELIK